MAWGRAVMAMGTSTHEKGGPAALAQFSQGDCMGWILLSLDFIHGPDCSEPRPASADHCWHLVSAFVEGERMWPRIKPPQAPSPGPRPCTRLGKSAAEAPSCWLFPSGCAGSPPPRSARSGWRMVPWSPCNAQVQGVTKEKHFQPIPRPHKRHWTCGRFDLGPCVLQPVMVCSWAAPAPAGPGSSRDGLSGSGVKVGLGNLKGFFQPGWFCDHKVQCFYFA